MEDIAVNFKMRFWSTQRGPTLQWFSSMENIKTAQTVYLNKKPHGI